MDGYNFTERARKVLSRAREESVRLHHEYVGTEHVLLGLIKEGEGVGVVALERLNVDLDAARAQLEEIVRPGLPTSHVGPELPYTSRTKHVLQLAMEQARALNHRYVGSEHLLLTTTAAVIRRRSPPLRRRRAFSPGPRCDRRSSRRCYYR